MSTMGNGAGVGVDPRQAPDDAIRNVDAMRAFTMVLNAERQSREWPGYPAEAQADVETVESAIKGLALKRDQLTASGRYTTSGVDAALKAERDNAIKVLSRFLKSTDDQLATLRATEERIASGAVARGADGTWSATGLVRDPAKLSIADAVRLMEIRTYLRSIGPDRADDVALRAFEAGDREVLESVESAPAALPVISSHARNLIRSNRLMPFAAEKERLESIIAMRERVADHAKTALGFTS